MIAHQAAEEPNVEDLEKDVFDGPALRVRYRIVEGLIPKTRSKVPLKNCSLFNNNISNRGNLVGLSLTYLSSAIAHRLRMEAVQQRTSKVSHVLQTKLPNTHLDKWLNCTCFQGY